jgi:hypothetical protein
MEAHMKQTMSMNGFMHDTFWRNDQIMVLFRSDIPLIEDGILNKEPLLQKLNLPLQLRKLNQFLHDQFLRQKRAPVTLTFLDDEEKHVQPEQLALENVDHEDNSKEPSGVYLFGLTSPIKTTFGVINTSVISFLKIDKGDAHSAGDTLSEGAAPENDHGDNNHGDSLIPAIVATLNDGLNDLNSRSEVPIVLSAPTWLCGGTPGIGQGCPLTPPIPVKDACSNWHTSLPDLDPQLQSMTGEGVTIFILDSFPERGVISRAADDAGSNNQLLNNVNETVSFDYSLMSGVQEILDMASTGNAAVGKDVYGRHYRILMPDHGLFIAGIVRDVASNAKVECIRVLNGLCVGDLNMLTGALWKIYNRMLKVNPDTGQVGDLYQRPVVINLSLVIPTDEEAAQKQISSVADGFNIIQASPFFAITSLTQVGAIVVASAGNEGDLREMLPGEHRPTALYPAAFSDSIDNVIAVGAVTSTGKAASYSCYPGPRGIATYGGEVPDPMLREVQPPTPPSSDPVVMMNDALRGIYSSVEYPPLSVDPPEQYYAAPNAYAWAYWIGTSFATPIISAVAARILELKATGVLTNDVRDAIMKRASGTVQWDKLDPGIVPGGSVDGLMLKTIQICV